MSVIFHESESATFDCLSFDNAGITKFVVQIYPFLYPQMIGLGVLIFYIIGRNETNYFMC